jgi:hypothetical protein
MAEDTQQPEIVVRAMSPEEQAELNNQAIWKSKLEAQQKRTETIPGGFFLDPSGNPVNANGEPITDRTIAELEAERDALNASLPPHPYA